MKQTNTNLKSEVTDLLMAAQVQCDAIGNLEFLRGYTVALDDIYFRVTGEKLELNETSSLPDQSTGAPF